MLLASICTSLLLIACSVANQGGKNTASSPTRVPASPLPAKTLPATQKQPPVAEDTLPAPEITPLSPTGPRILLSTESGLWAMNTDGSGLVQLAAGRIVSPANLQEGLSPGNTHLAYITAEDQSGLRGLALNLLDLSRGTARVLTLLSSPENEQQAGADVCQPGHEALRAAAIGSSLQWSPDGSKLAFTGSMQSATADVYIYSLDDEQITRLSNEPGHAYDLHWLSNSDTITYFSASCFGTGAGFNMEGVWKIDASAAKAELLYRPNPESWGEEFIIWARSGKPAFFVASISGCPYRDLRLVDMETNNVTAILDGCFDDITVGPTSSLAVLVSGDFSEKPGLYLYTEPDIPGLAPVYIAEADGRQVRYIAPQVFISVFNGSVLYFRSFDWNGTPGWYQGQGDFPVISKNGEAWAWNENGTFYLSGKEMQAPVILSGYQAGYPFWYEDAHGSDIYQRLLYFVEEDEHAVYGVTGPGYQPELLGKNIHPLAAPLLVWP